LETDANNLVGIRRAVSLALASFMFAGAVGVWMRAASLGVGLPADAIWVNIRHGHSHVMFFSWVTPALMAVITVYMRARGARMSQIDNILIAGIFLGVLSFVPFMLSGYHPSIIAGKRIPLSVIFSTLAMFTWYAFAWGYFKERHVLKGAARQTLSLAVGVLVLSTIGAWLRGFFVATKETDRFLTDGSVHAFVTTFSLGWLFVATLGILHLRYKTPLDRRLKLTNYALAFGLSGTWVLSIAQNFVPKYWWAFGALCSMVFGLAAFTHVGILWRHRAARVVLFPAAAVSLSQGYAALPGIMRWADRSNLRIPYLHTLFLLVVSVVLVQEISGWVEPSKVVRAQKCVHAFTVSAWCLVIGLGPTTGLWPNAFRSSLDPWIVTLSAALPVLSVAAFVWVSPRFPRFGGKICPQ